MSKYDKVIKEFIEDVCDILQIKAPKVSEDFPVVEEVTDTTLALCDPSGEGLSNPVKRVIRQRMESLWKEYGE